MAYVQPNSRIEFFDDLGISQDYNDTLYFATTAAKDTYFDNIQRLAHADNCYYTRDNRGFVRVELPMTTLIAAQYMRFKNTSYENKWWYAFVDDVIYVNNNTTEVKFTLDPMLSWMGSFSVKDCFVERQHSETDYIGANTIPEEVNVNNMVVRNRRNTHTCGLYYPVIFMSHKDVSWIEPGYNLVLFQNQYIGGVYNALDMVFCRDAAAVNFVVEKLIEEVWIDDVVTIKMLPYNFYPISGSEGDNRIVSFSAPKPYTSLDGYTPKNNKLFTYPFNYLSVNNSEGEENSFRYEWFGALPPNQNTNLSYTFQIYGAWSSNPQLLLVPTSYKGVTGSNYEERLSMQEFPSCGWNVDTFKAMLAQKETELPTRLLASSMNAAAMGTLTNSNLQRNMAIRQGVQGITDVLANKIIPPNMPTIVRGNQGTNTLVGQKTYDSSTPPVQNGTEKDFICTELCASYEDARNIDGFFTMFA